MPVESAPAFDIRPAVPHNSNKRLITPVTQSTDTKDLILDAAELLFSENGVEGVSLRALTSKAGVNLASVHYHFGSKEGVALAAFCRRVRPINEERLELLDKAESEGAADVESILTALYAPALRLAGSPVHGRRFMRMCARFYTEPGAYLESAFTQEFAHVITRFEGALHRALPDLSRLELRRRLHFGIGVMVHTLLDSNRTRQWTDDACDPSDIGGTLDAMVSFVAAGFRAGTATPAAGTAGGAGIKADRT